MRSTTWTVGRVAVDLVWDEDRPVGTGGIR